MGRARSHTLTAVTNGSGAVTAKSPRLTGTVHSIQYAKTDYADTVDFAITAADRGETIWTEENVTASKTVHPRATVNDTAGTVIGDVYSDVVLTDEQVQIAVTNGGDAKTGVFTVVVIEYG